MTEAEWLTCENPLVMLTFLRGRLSERKLRCFSLACGRRYCCGEEYWPENPVLITLCQRLLDAAELHADGCESLGVVEALHHQLGVTPGVPQELLTDMTAALGGDVAYWTRHYGGRDTNRRERLFQASLLRDLAANPFRPVVVEPDWFTWENGRVVSVAGALYAERAFDRLASLAEVLQAAGCGAGELVEHCRVSGHVRGCWVVDLVLGLT